ncbi:MAG: MFS transporter, partial [Dongiaceae bacterium]
LLRGQALGLDVAHVPLLLAAMSLMTTFMSAPTGRLSDRVGRRPLMIGGFALLIASHLVRALAGGPALVFVGAVLFGLHFAITEAVLAALVADMAPADLRGTAFGLFHLMSGIAILIGSLAAGWIWDGAGAATMFLIAAAVSLIGLLLLLTISRPGAKNPNP